MLTEAQKRAQKKYKVKNREKLKIQGKIWRDKNKDRLKEYQRRYREKHREKERSYGRDYYHKKREKFNEYLNKWKAKNPDKVKESRINWFKRKVELAILFFDGDEIISSHDISSLFKISRNRGTAIINFMRKIGLIQLVEEYKQGFHAEPAKYKFVK